MPLTTARGTHARPLAEFVFMALLAHWRGLAHLQAEQRAHRWQRYCIEEVAGRTLVILGAGDLARGAARIAKALDMQVVAIARDPGKAREHNDLFDEVVGTGALHAALGRADAVLLTVPHTPETERMIDAAAIAAMRPWRRLRQHRARPDRRRAGADRGPAQRPCRLRRARRGGGGAAAEGKPALGHAERADQPAFGQHPGGGECAVSSRSSCTICAAGWMAGRGRCATCSTRSGMHPKASRRRDRAARRHATRRHRPPAWQPSRIKPVMRPSPGRAHQ